MRIPKIKSIIRNYLFSRGYLITRVQDDSYGESIFESLRPVRTCLDLIRIGSDYDGGYLVPNDLEDIEGVVSPGVGGSSNFELFFAAKGIRSVLADPNVLSPPESSEMFTFLNKRVSGFDDDKNITLDSLNAHFPNGKDLILQMDIEGGEYEVFSDVSEAILRRYRIMIIEFHFLDNLFVPVGGLIIQRIFNKIRKHFLLVHVHPNNVGGAVYKSGVGYPIVLEATFIRSDRVEQVYGVSKLPNPLDRTCNPNLPELATFLDRP